MYKTCIEVEAEWTLSHLGIRLVIPNHRHFGGISRILAFDILASLERVKMLPEASEERCFQ